MLQYLEQYKYYAKLVETTLSLYLSEQDKSQQSVFEAMKYSLLGGGKRLRGVLTLSVCKTLGGNVKVALPLACALEMIHAYSLIHDDLPCMDNDVLRRGKATCHVQFGEAIALLAGDALLTKAFEIVIDSSDLSDIQKVNAVGILAKAAGANGMIGGQVIDIESENTTISETQLKELQTLKTGALICAAVKLGAVAGMGNEIVIDQLDKYAQNIGLMFQITDDILDATSTTEQLGKTVGSDIANNKTTYVTLLGMDYSLQTVQNLLRQSLQFLSELDADTTFLAALVEQMATRTK